MKEYKIVQYRQKPFLIKFKENLEDLLNKHAKAGWTLKETNATFTYFIFERDKNR
ncbi:MAG: DUF4177 domain-containing protein [Polaribacter sp.]